MARIIILRYAKIDENFRSSVLKFELSYDPVLKNNLSGLIV